MSIVFLTALSGVIVYGLFWKSFGKNKAETSRSSVRKYHRSIGVVVSVFLLAWSGSGMFHLWSGTNLGDAAKVGFANSFKTDNFKFSLTGILKTEPQTVSASVIGLDKEMYFRVVKTDQTISYYNTKSGEVLVNGEVEYAKFLASKFSGNQTITEVTPITNFNVEYGFVNKRLPVMKVQSAENGNERVYVDTQSGKLAMKASNNNSTIENFTFDYLHKGHWLDWAGKNVRDVVLMLLALGNSIVAALGIWLFVGLKRRDSRIVP